MICIPISSLEHESKFQRKVREISEPIFRPAVVNFINSDWLLSLGPLQGGSWFFSQQLVRYCQVSYKKCSWSMLLRNQLRCCMSLHDHSSIRKTVEMFDFVCLCRQFETRLPTAPSATECSDLKSAAMAAARPTTNECLLQLGGTPWEATVLCPLHVQPSACFPRWRVQWAAARRTTIQPQHPISGRCMALPAPPATTTALPGCL